jgi:hypothetical protein
VLLNFIFLVHTAVALLVALLLLFYPDWFTAMVTGVTWTPGPMATIATVYARYTAVGLIFVAMAASIARQSPSTPVRRVAVVTMILISLIGLIVSLFVPFQPMQTYTVLINLFFLLAYVGILYFLSSDI